MLQRLFYCILLYVLLDNFCIGENSDHNQIHSRIKRYEQFSEEVPDEWSKAANPSEECESWFQCIMDFFFGAVDMARGNPGGLFTRMMNWVKKGWCHMTSQCENDDPHPEPSPDFIRPNLPSVRPPVDVTTPAVEPDAEPVTESEEEKKDANDVQ